MSLEDRCRREIEQLHDFFARWFNAEVEETDEVFARFESVLAEGFVLIDLEGTPIPREQLVSVIRDRWGRHAGDGRGIDIETDACQLIQSEENVHLATYIERQRTAESSNERRSSVLFRETEPAPHGLEWLYVHETPMS